MTSIHTCPDGSGDVKAMTSSDSATETLPVDVKQSKQDMSNCIDGALPVAPELLPEPTIYPSRTDP